MDILLDKTSWQDKRIKAMDRTIFRKKFTHEYLVDEYCAIINSKAKNKKQYKAEQKAKIEKFRKNLPKELPYDK